MIKPWPERSRQRIASTRVFDVHLARRASPRTGLDHDFALIDCPDWVNVVALTHDGQLVMVEQYRHGTATVTLEVPGGMIDPGETPAEAARRELREETGYDCEALQWLGVVEPNPALQTNRCHSFLATGCRLVQPPQFDSTEDCALRLEPAARARELVQSGAISHALVVVALSHAWLRGALPQ